MKDKSPKNITPITTDQSTSARSWTMDGPSIQMDPLFPYYLNRSTESVADEIWLSGYRIVHYFVINESRVLGELIYALHQRGIAVWALVLGNGTFDVSHLPPNYPEWRMGLLQDPKDGFERFSFFSSEYVLWKKEAVAKLVRDYPFDGIEIAESYFPEWDGIRSGVYGDIGPLAEEAFQRQCGQSLPDFRNEQSANYYTKVQEVYANWMSFRVEAVNDFVAEVIRGVGGVREVRPDIKVATWSLAVNDIEAGAKLREWQGMDAVSMIERVKPDLHMIQTHWPDWMQRNLPADYLKYYECITLPIRNAFPELPLGMQTDIGSIASMVRNQRWLNQFQNTVYDLGYDTWTAYEYHLGGYMTEEPPMPLVAKLKGTQLIISYSKRIDPQSVTSILIYCTSQQSSSREKSFPPLPLHIDLIRDPSIEVDGNRMLIHSNQWPTHPFEVEIMGVKDTPTLWYSKGKRANHVPAGIRIKVE